MDIAKEIKDSIPGKKLVIGTKETFKSMKRGDLRLAILASNCPDLIKRDAGHYQKAGGAEVITFEGDSISLGQVCGKPFKILAVGIMK